MFEHLLADNECVRHSDRMPSDMPDQSIDVLALQGSAVARRQAARTADEQWRDKRRDNANAARGIVTLRFGLLDLGDRRCQTRS